MNGETISRTLDFTGRSRLPHESRETRLTLRAINRLRKIEEMRARMRKKQLEVYKTVYGQTQEQF